MLEFIFHSRICRGVFALGLCFMVCASAQAQIKDGLKAVKKGDMDAAFSAFKADVGTEYVELVAMYNMAKLYMNPEFSNHNIDSAGALLSRAIAGRKGMPSDMRSKLSKMDETFSSVKTVKKKAARAAYALAEEENTVDGYNSFIKYHWEGDRALDSKASKSRNKMIIAQTKAINTPAAWEELMTEYGANMKKKTPAFYKRAEMSLFETSMRQNGWNTYDAFAKKYPKNVYVKDSSRVEYLAARDKNNLHAYQTFVDIYTESTYVNMAVNDLAEHTAKENTIDAYSKFLTTYPKHEKADDLWLKFYKVYKQGAGAEEIKLFKYEYENFPHKDVLEKDLAVLNSDQEETDWRKAKAEDTFEGYFEFIQNHKMGKRLEEAKTEIYDELKDSDSEADLSYFVQSFPKHEKANDIWEKLYEKFKNDYGLDKLQGFLDRYPDFPFKARAKMERETYLREGGGDN